MTILVRDRAQDDKVVKVIEPIDTVQLTYDFETNDGRLSFVKTNYPNYNGVEVDQIHKLYYGDYLNSKKEVENVLTKIRQSTKFGDDVLENVQKIRTCVQCPVFDELDKELSELSTNTGGDTA